MRRYWERFRGWPIWAQVLTWAVLALVVIAAIGGGEDEDPDEQASEVVQATTTETTQEAPTTTDAPTTTTSPATSTTSRVTTTEGDGDGEDDEALSLSEAYCNDLEAGFAPFQIFQGQSLYDDPEEFADLSYGWAAIACPEQLEENEALRAFLENWGIDPDA